jgi:hypothetical protein
VWEDSGKHAASLALPSEIDAISKGHPLIAEFGERFETKPLVVEEFSRTTHLYRP